MDNEPLGAGGPPQPEFTSSKEQEKGEPPEAVRRQYELYTVEGRDYIQEIKEVIETGDVEKMREVTEASVGYMEGLYFGIEGDNYDLDDDFVAGELMDMFTDVESSSDRPSYQNVFLALRQGITQAVRDADRYNKEKKKGEEGIANWRFKYLQERKMYWEMQSQTNILQGLPGFDNEAIIKKITEETNEHQAKVESWFNNKSELIALKYHIDARVLTFDRAFTQRQQGCEVGNTHLKIREGGVKPDKGSWMAYYWGNREKKKWNEEGISEWGDKVSHVENVIERIALGDKELIDKLKEHGLEDNPADDYYVRDIYVHGFRDVNDFRAWMKVLLEKSTINGETRMDVVWNAWKMSLWKENISKLAWRVDKDGRYQFGVPPFLSDLNSKMIHSDKIRMKELGCIGINKMNQIMDLDEKVILDRHGNKIQLSRSGTKEDEEKAYEAIYEDYMRNLQRSKNKPYRAISHSGHPMSIGRIGKLVDEYEAQTEVADIKKWEEGGRRGIPVDISLRDLVRRGVSRGSREFPWEATQLRSPGDPVGEAPSLSVGGWFLSAVRADGVRNDFVRKMAQPREMSVDYFEQLRNWEKIKKLNPGPLKYEVPQNPFAWYLAGVLRARSLAQEKSKYLEGERGYQSTDQQNKTSALHAEDYASDGITADADILKNAERVGAISADEKGWIENNIVWSKGKRRTRV